MNHDDTIAAICTGLTNSGIGIIRISGPEAFSILSKIYRTKSGKLKNDFESHKVYYGYINDNDKVIDEVLVITLKAPKSFTMEDTVEINCHGGNLVMKKILRTVINNGARIAENGEFTKRAFLNGRLDLSEAEAVSDIISSDNDISLNNSVMQLKGSIYEEIKKVRASILYETAFIESALDDPEHYDLEGYPDRLRDVATGLVTDIKKLIDSYNDGKIIKEGIKTVIVGRPNVGKSSLLNELIGEDRAIVTDIPGTTRDTLEERILINGISLNIVDTAGIHYTEDVVEKIGVDRARNSAETADLILLVLDSSVELNDTDSELIDFINNKKAIILINKTDLNSVIDIDKIEKSVNCPVIKISVSNKSGIDDFKKCVTDMFMNDELLNNSNIIITNERHLSLLNLAYNSLNEVIMSIDNGMSEDFMSIDLYAAYETLGYIIGEAVSDDVINEIFSKFCMGK